MAVEGFAARRDVPEPQVRRIYGMLLCFFGDMLYRMRVYVL